jgi:hypothetical protein
MWFFKRDNMFFLDYLWEYHPAVDPHVPTPAEKSLFNKADGNHVLYMVNKLFKLKRLEGLQSAHKIERIIRSKLPVELVYHRDVRQWLFENWEKY